MMRDLLVVTPTLGESAHLDEVIKDVADLAGHISLAHVVVAPRPVTDRLRREYPHAVVVEDEKRDGIYHAIQEGVHAVEGWQWLTWINDDDRLRPGFADLWQRAIQSTQPADVWYGNVTYIDEQGAAIALMPTCRRPSDVPALLASGVAPFTQQGTVISSEMWRHTAGVDTGLRIAGDFALWFRAIGAGARFEYVPADVAGYRLRAGQLSSNTALAQVEIDQVLRDHPLQISPRTRRIALIRFRAFNLGRIIRRAARTGLWRTARMFSRP